MFAHLNVGHSADGRDHWRLLVELVDVLVDWVAAVAAGVDVGAVADEGGLGQAAAGAGVGADGGRSGNRFYR